MKKILLPLCCFFFVCSICFGQWEATSGPPGGTVKAIIRNSEFLFAAVEGDGVYRTPLDTIAWQEVNSGLTNISIKAFGVMGDRIFAGTNTGVFRTDDNGDNWNDQTSQVNQNVLSFASDDDEIYAGCSPTIFRSVDSGITWLSLTYSGQYYQYDLLLRNDTIYTGCDDFLGQPYWGVRVSYDHGTNWQPISTGLNDYGVYSIAAMQNHFFAGTIGHGVYKSTITNPNWSSSNSGIETRSFYDMVVIDTTLIALTDDGLYSSDDYGTTWNEWGNFPNLLEPISIFNSDSSIYIGASGFGLMRTNKSGLNFSSLGIPKAEVIDMVANDSVIFCAGIFGIVYRSFDFGLNWKYLPNYEPGFSGSAGMVLSDHDLFMGTSKGCFYSGDFGSTWQKRDFGLNGDTEVYRIDKGINDLYVSTYYHLYRSSDNAMSWQMIPEPDSLINPFYTPTIAENENYLFATPDYTGFYRTSDLGQNWEDIVNGTPLQNLWLYSPAICGNRLFIIGYDFSSAAKIYYSEDNGNSWSSIADSTGFTSLVAENIFIKGDSIIAPTEEDGIFVSPDRGNLWYSVSEGLPNDYFKEIAIAGNYLFAGSLSHGVWRRPLSEIFSGSTIITFPNQILNVFPNPTSGQLNIRMTPASDLVVVEIFDVYGRKEKSAEIHSIAVKEFTFDASYLISNLATGVYEVIVKSGTKVYSTRVIKISN